MGNGIGGEASFEESALVPLVPPDPPVEPEHGAPGDDARHGATIPERAAPPLPPGLVASFWAGLGLPFRGLAYLAARPRLWGLSAVPVVVAVILLGVAVALAVTGSGDLLALLWDRPAGAGPWSALLAAAWVVAAVLLGVLLVGVAGVLVYATAGILATPALDLLSERVEADLLGPREEPLRLRTFLKDTWTSVVHSLLNLALWGLVMAPLLLLNLVPVLGSLVSAALGAVVTAIFFARDVLDGPLTRRRLRYREKLRVVAQNRALMLGLGAGTAILLWVPVLNLLTLPAAITGGALAYVQLDQAGRLSPDRGAPRRPPAS